MTDLNDWYVVDLEFNGRAGFNKWISREEAKCARMRIREICNSYGGKLSHMVGLYMAFSFESNRLSKHAVADLCAASDLRLAKLRVRQVNSSDNDSRACSWHLSACRTGTELGVVETELRQLGEHEDFWPIKCIRDTCASLGGKFFDARVAFGEINVTYRFDDEARVCLAQEILEDRGFDVEAYSCMSIVQSKAA